MRAVFAPASWRALVGLAAGLAAAAAVVVMVVTPAVPNVSVVEWPAPGNKSGLGADTSGVTPLLLAAHAAARLEVQATCAAVGEGPRTLLATTRRPPYDLQGLRLSIADGRLRLDARGAKVADAPVACPVRLVVDGSRWRLHAAGRSIGSGSFAPDRPLVSGLVSDVASLSSDAGPALRVVVTSDPAGSSPSAAQWALLATASAAAVVALATLARPGRRRWRPAWRRVFVYASPVDALVVVTMAVWAVVGAVFYDDGWVVATAANAEASGQFSTYYDALDAPVPFGWAHDLLVRLFLTVSHEVLWLRVLPFLFGLACWVACRAALASVVRYPSLRSRWVRGHEWAMAAVFLLFWVAWLSTVRPEPMVAAAGAGVLLAAYRFTARPSGRTLAAGALVATFATTLHPNGLVAWAPLIAIAPNLWGWSRNLDTVGRLRLMTATALIGSFGLALLLADTDLGAWLRNRALVAGDGAHKRAWHDELQRYELLLIGPTVRRASVFFAGIAVFLFLTRHRRRWQPTIDVPATALVLAAGIFLFTPSKWPWHFGAVMPFAAVAFAVELARVRAEEAERSAWFRQAQVLAATVVASLVAWRAGQFWHVLTPRTRALGHGGTGLLPVDLASPLVWAAVIAVGLVVLRRRPGALATWLAPMSAAVIVTSTVAAFVLDAVESRPGWTIAEQNLEIGRAHRCGLADHLRVPDLEAAVPLALTTPQRGADPPSRISVPRLNVTTGRSLPHRPSPVIGEAWSSYVNGDEDVGWFASPWYRLPSGSSTDGSRVLATIAAGRTRSQKNGLFVQYGDDREPASPVLLDAIQDGDGWALLSLPRPPTNATRVRLIGVDHETGLHGWLAFSAPAAFSVRTLSAIDREYRPISVVSPQYRVYLPCLRHARVSGLVEFPRLVVGDTASPFLDFSPFKLLADIGTLVKLPVTLDGRPADPPLEVYLVATRDGSPPPLTAEVRSRRP